MSTQASVEDRPPDRRAKLLSFARERGPAVALEIIVNFVLPVLVYDWAKPAWGDVGALLASSGPPILWSVVEFLRHRRVDAMSMLVLGGIALSLLAFLGGGSARLLQLRERLVTVVIGLAFLGSAAIGKPLIYQLARASMQRKSSPELAQFEALRDNKHFRRAMTVMTLVWGFGLVAEGALAVVLVFVMPVRDYLIAGRLLGYGVLGLLGLWTFWYARRQRRMGQARRAAMESAGQAS